MKFKLNQYLYYVCPYVFTIEVVFISFSDVIDEVVHYVEETGAYLAEDCLALTLQESRDLAVRKLNAFYDKKIKEINDEVII